MYLMHLYRKIQRQVASPWTKLSVLVLLTILVTRNDLSFSFSLNGGNLFGLGNHSVFDEVTSNGSASLVSLSETKSWSPRQLQQLTYVDRYKDIARREMRKEGIPASVTLAQALLESGTGESVLATKNNNHFGLKCFSRSCKQGHCSNHSDDSHKDFFRIFPDAEASFKAHSELLQKKRYAGLFELVGDDYRGWAKGLSKAGYATDPKYPEKLIHLIESLQLYRYDR